MNERTYSTPYKDSMSKAQTLIANREGETIDRSTGLPVNPWSGYIVGGASGDTLVLPLDEQIDSAIYAVARWIDRQPSFLNTTTYYGVWTDTETELVYFDLSTHVENWADAIRLARSRGELAIWDCRNQREIRVS